MVRRGAKGGKPRKVPRSTLLEAKGLLRRSLFLSVLRERGPSKKHPCFLEGAAWNFSWLAPLGPRLSGGDPGQAQREDPSVLACA